MAFALGGRGGGPMRAALALGLAVLPGLYAWLWGRRLARLSADPALPERYLGHRIRVAQIAAVAAAVLLMLLRPHWVWAIPALFLAVQAGGFPSRRAILGESWGLRTYLGHVLRLTTAGLGFWLLLAFTPAFIPDFGPARWPMAVVLAAILLAWQARHAEAFLSLTRAAPLDRPDLAPRLVEVAGRSRADPPRLRRVGAPGGRWANAFALPSLGGSTVVFTDTLLEQLAPDELAAIYAHELAHLEHHDRRRLLRGRVVLWAAIAAATLAIPLARAALGVEGSRLDWAWALVVMLSLALYGTHHRTHEAESDARAVALSGDAEALVRALVKLHALARLPRRWDPDLERRSTHPSLSQRIQAIRAAGGVVSSGLEQPVLLRSPDAGRRVVLEAARIHWLEGVPSDAPADAGALREQAASVLSVPYHQLTELRVRAALGGAARLVAADLAGRTWSWPLEASEVSPAQAALDLVEGRLAVPPSGWMHHPAMASVLSTLAVLASVLAGQFGPVLIPGLVGMFRSSQGTLAALGASAVATGLLAVRRPEGAAAPPVTTLTAVALASLVVFGALAMVVALLRARAVIERRTRTGLVTAALLGLFAVVVWAGLVAAAAGVPRALRLHQAAQARPAATVALLGMAAALALARRPGPRWAALAATVLAAVPVVAGSRWFLDRFARDPFLADPPRLHARPVAAQPVRETRIGSAAAQLRLSPSASRFAVRPVEAADADDEGSRPRRRLSVRSFSGPERDLEAEDLRFLNDLRVLALVRVPSGLELRAVSLDDAQDISWSAVLPDVRTPRLELDPGLGVWRVTGTDAAARAAVVLRGRLNESAVEEARWALLPAAEEGVALPAVVSHEGALVVRVRLEPGAIPGLMLAGAPSVPLRSELWALGPGAPRLVASSGLELRCVDPPVSHPDATFTCLAFDGRRTLLWSVDARSGHLEPRASLAGRVFALHPSAHGRLLGWAETGLVRVDAARGELVELQLPADADRPFELAPVGDSLGALAATHDGAIVTVYQIAR
jgi:Zn-dependent protease with chaperone function